MTIPSSKELLRMQYRSDLSAAQVLQAAQSWGQQAIDLASGPVPRPPALWSGQRPLRVGYVSPDLCVHTVGLLVRDVMSSHNPQRLQVFAYNASPLRDWVTEHIAQYVLWREVGHLSDAELAEQIRQDEVDVLIDLAGHTAGTRLSVFAHRPAAVQVSWLGYFATTGLDCIDAVLLDNEHAPPGTEGWFTEHVHRMPQGRWCYTPVPYAPLFTMPRTPGRPFTFGSFNNTDKHNPELYDLWAEVLQAVPGSQLLLKWRTLANDDLCQEVRHAFERRSIDPQRLEFRSFSTHHQALLEYADVDVSLDTRPFTGGLTTFESLWCGAPVVTWPDQRVVSRQSSSILKKIGKPEWVAHSAKDYIRIAQSLAADPQALALQRRTLRSSMIASGIMSAKAFAHALEEELMKVYRQFSACA